MKAWNWLDAKWMTLKRNWKKQGCLPLPLRMWNIKGAPFKIGDRVKVVKASDEHCDVRFIGAVGRVIWLDYDISGGPYPDDPMMGVRFDGGHVDSFWKEELKGLPEVNFTQGGISSVPCERCGRADLPLFPNYVCPDCATEEELKKYA